MLAREDYLREESTGTARGAETRMVAWSSLPYLPLNAVLVWSRCGLGMLAALATSMLSEHAVKLEASGLD